MMNLQDTLNATLTDHDGATTIEIDRLSSLVEAQIGNVLGGGYSQYSAVHGKSVLL